MSITFAVDDVTPAAEPLALDPQPLRRLGEGILVSHTHLAPRLPAAYHGLVASLGVAFRQHRPFLLTPDAVWLTIAQGVAGHINANSERLRPHFVRHQGKTVLTVRVEDLDVAGWEGAFHGFAEALGKEVGPGLARLLTCDFSTTDPVTRAASRVVLMDALKEYFDYGMMCVCGIPRVTLAGTVDDWRDVRRRVEALAEHDLGWWRDALLPLADRWVETASGRVDRAFWQQMYISISGYGGVEIVEGWVQRLFPELGLERRGFAPFARDESFFEENARMPDDTTWLHAGVGAGAFGPGMVETLVRKNGVGGDALYKVLAGFVAVGEVDGFVTPVVGWAVREDPLAATIQKLAARIERRSPQPAVPASARGVDDDGNPLSRHGRHAWSGAQRAWDDVLGEDEVEIDGVRFLPAQIVERRPTSGRDAHVVAEVIAGGWLGFTMNTDYEDVIFRAVPDVPAEEWPVVALSFLELFQRMAEEGAYFLRPGYVPRAVLGAGHR